LREGTSAFAPELQGSIVANDKGFRDRVQQIGERVQELESIGDRALQSKAKELVQSLMELHGSAVERMLEVIFQSENAGARMIDELGEDPLVSSLLILYGLHPEDVQTRVEKKLTQLKSRLYKMGAEVTSIAVNDSEVRVRVNIEGHTCGSTSQNVRLVVEDAVYEAAPDLKSLVVEGLQEPSSSGFVAMDALTSTRISAIPESNRVPSLGVSGSD
jgi:hypothetical protein